jgi:predicted nucleic acid-binding Zn ribbon protein
MLTLKRVFEDLAKQNDFFKKLLVLSTLEDKIPQILGVGISKHCTFKALEGDIVIIECDDYIWANELKKMKRQIKKRIEQSLNLTFQDIKIEVNRK